MCITTPEIEVTAPVTSVCLDGRQEPIAFVGPSMQGVVYASIETNAMYRLIPLDDMPAERRHAIQSWAETFRVDATLPVRGFARTTCGDDGRSVYVIMYCPTAPVISLQTILTREPLRTRLECVARAVQSVAAWQRDTGPGLYLMPADMVFCGGEGPVLLPMPAWRPPAMAKVLRNFEWASYLPPEFFTHRQLPSTAPSGDAVDRFAIGMSILRCICDAPPSEPIEHRLLRAATGTLAATHLTFKRVASWQSNLSATRSILKLVDELTHPNVETRCSRSWPVVASLLDAAVGRFDARHAVIEERSRNSPESALQLVQEILLEEESPELNLLAGKLAAECQRILQAVDMLERAMGDGPVGDEARNAQFMLIVGARNAPSELQNLFRYRPDIAAQLVCKVWRNYRALPPRMQDERADVLAEFLLWNGQFNSVSFTTVIEFVNERIQDADGNILWWKFGLLLCRLEAIIAQNRIDDAWGQLDYIRQGLARVRQNKSMAPEQIHAYGVRFSHLERMFLELRTSHNP